MFRMGLKLMIICLAASLVLAVTYKITLPAIRAQKASEEETALKQILPQADKFLEGQAGRFTYYEGFKNKDKVGCVLKVRAKGYGGNIDMLVGIDSRGAIQAVEVLSQQETPGLGSRITEIRQGEGKPWFLQQFKGKIAGDLKMSDPHSGAGIQAISGATISSTAVLDAIKNEVKEFLDRI